MKKILIISQYFYPEPFRINDIAEEWVKRGYQVEVVTGIPNYPQGKFYSGYGLNKNREEIYNGIKIHRIPLLPRGEKSVTLIMNYISFVVSGYFWKLFTTIEADLVFSFEVSPMTQVLLGVWYSQKFKVPHFLYLQDLWPDNVKIVSGINNKFILNQLSNLSDYIYKNTDKIFVTSNSLKKTLIERNVPQSKIEYWPQYAEEFMEENTELNLIPQDSKLNITFAGNIGNAQGLEILPLTAQLLSENEIKNVRFNIIGDGRYKEQLVSEVSKRDLGDYFNFIDRQPSKNIPFLLDDSDFAYLSFSDNDLFSKTIPAKLQTYLASGIPVLGSARGESKVIIEDNDIGFCGEPGNAVELKENIVKATKLTIDEINQLGKNGYNYYLTEFYKETLMDKMDTYINEFI